MKNKAKKRKLSRTSLKRNHQHTTRRRTWHSQPPSSIRRPRTIGPKGCEVGVFVWKFQKMEFKLMRSRDEEMQTKRHTFGAHFHTSESIEGPGKRKGTFQGRRRDRHAIACRRSSRIERRNGSHGRIPSKIAAPSSSPASPSLILEETVHQIARLVAAVVRDIPFYNVERVKHQEQERRTFR